MYSPVVDNLIAQLTRLPGVGTRTAQRLAFHLLRVPREEALALADAIREAKERIGFCRECGNLTEEPVCGICTDTRRDARQLCVVEDVADLWALDRARLFTGRYHVLGGRLSALDGVRPEDLAIGALLERVAAGGIDEVVLAMNATLEGQTTAHYIAERLEAYPVRVTQLAHGLPVGGELDYLDEGTLAQALRARRPVG